MRVAWMAVLALPLLAQSPEGTPFQGDPAQVMLACANRAFQLDPKNRDVLLRVGRVHLLGKDRAKAEACFAAAHPSKPAHHLRIGHAWLEAGYPVEALKAYRAFPALFPKAKNEFTEVAVHLMDAGLIPEAEEFMGVAFRVDPGDWQNVTAFGRACIRAKRQDLAADWFLRAMEKNRKEENLWDEMALALADQGAER